MVPSMLQPRGLPHYAQSPKYSCIVRRPRLVLVPGVGSLHNWQASTPLCVQVKAEKDKSSSYESGDGENSLSPEAFASQGADPSPSRGSPSPATITSSAQPSSSTKGAAKNADLLQGEADGSGDEEDSKIVIESAAVLQRLFSAGVVYGLALVLSGWTGTDYNSQLVWGDGSAFFMGAVATLPAIAVTATLFAPTIDMGLNEQKLLTVARTAEEIEDFIDLRQHGRSQAPVTETNMRQAVWFYQMGWLQPWLYPLQGPTLAFLYAASCMGTYAEDLVVRGWGGHQLAGWYNGLLASGAADINNPLFWAQVFKLVGPDTGRWLAALSVFSLQVSFYMVASTRGAAFTRVSLNRLGRVEPPPPGSPAAQAFVIAAKEDLSQPLEDPEGPLLIDLGLPTPEEKLVYWCNVGVAALLMGAVNATWAATGSLVGSCAAKVIFDGVALLIQDYKLTRLPEERDWAGVRNEILP